jgi:hypothetical protein
MSGNDLRPSQRIPLLILGFVSLAFGIAGGLWRAGWEVPLIGTQPASFHGALMVAAFFGTVIALERATECGRRVAYLGPACAGLGGLLTALGAPHYLSAPLLIAGVGTIAVLAFAALRRERALHTVLSLGGAALGVLGNTLWLTELPSSSAVGAWLAFLVLTIAAERLELSHLRRPNDASLRLLGAAAAVLVVGALTLPFTWTVGIAMTGAGLVGVAVWLLANDVAQRNLRHHGIDRFTAICLVGGYVWLGIGGAILPFAAPAGLIYDAALHAVFVGFVFAMVIAHAPLIGPLILGVEIPYSSLFYAHLAVLEATLLLRVAGDLASQPALRAWGALGNAAALALFIAVTVYAALRARRFAD